MLNNPLKYVDPTGHAAETGWDAMNIAFGMSSLGANLSRGNLDAAFLDAGGLLIDSAAAATPFVPGFAGSTIRAKRAAQALPAAEALQLQRFVDKAVDAGKIGQSKVSKIPGVAARKIPNPDGKKGGPAHQSKVEEVAADIRSRGLDVDFEHMVPTPGAGKSKRFVDVVGRNPVTGEIQEMHQIGRQTKGGLPVSRERSAIQDIFDATKSTREFHPYE